MLCKQFNEILEVIMRDNTVWQFLYYLVLLAHYFGIGSLISSLSWRFGLLKVLSSWFVIWLCSGLVFNGCIFTYLEQYCALKAGVQTEMTYNLKESLAYRIVWRLFL